MKNLFNFLFDWSKTLPKAHTDQQKVLRYAIRNGSVSIKTFGYLCGFRTRISELNSIGVPFCKTIATDVNKNGNSYWYAVHSINEADKNKCIDIYLKLNK